MKRSYITAALIFVIAAFGVITLASGISKSGGERGSLMDDLYNQAVKQNNNLRSIEEEIEKFYKNKQEALEKYNSYTNYNIRYYTDAKTHAATIADVATKQRTLDLIRKSETEYYSKLTNWKNHISILDAQEKELKDLHQLLQVLTTIPIIERQQQTSLPDSNKLNETNTDLKQVIEKIKTITR